MAALLAAPMATLVFLLMATSPPHAPHDTHGYPNGYPHGYAIGYPMANSIGYPYG